MLVLYFSCIYSIVPSGTEAGGYAISKSGPVQAVLQGPDYRGREDGVVNANPARDGLARIVYSVPASDNGRSVVYAMDGAAASGAQPAHADNKAEGGASKSDRRVFYRELKRDHADPLSYSGFDDELENDLSANGFQSIERERFKTDVNDVNKVLGEEMLDLSPEVHGQIASSIRSNKVDRERYRDLFLIKKRIITDGDHRIVTFDIKERIIPKPHAPVLSKDPYTKMLFAGIMILLMSLVITTTMKMYQTVLKQRCIEGMEQLKQATKEIE